MTKMLDTMKPSNKKNKDSPIQKNIQLKRPPGPPAPRPKRRGEKILTENENFDHSGNRCIRERNLDFVVRYIILFSLIQRPNLLFI